MGFGIVIIGDEILSGRRADQHLSRSIEMLSARGLRLSWARYVGDTRDELVRLFSETMTGDDVVFSFGGIGATPDDHTRQAAAEAAGLAITLHPEAAVLINTRMLARFGAPATPQHLMMGEFPVGASIIPNPVNQVPGFSLRQHHFVPGFPQMAHPMMAWVLDTHYADLHNAQAWAEAAIHVFEVAESSLVDLMLRLQRDYGVTVFSLPSLSTETAPSFVELGAKGDPAAVDLAMADMRAEVAARGLRWREIT